MKTLINLISGQTIPNLIAQKFISPDKIILLYSKGSVKQKENFKSTYRNVQFEEYEILQKKNGPPSQLSKNYLEMIQIKILCEY